MFGNEFRVLLIVLFTVSIGILQWFSWIILVSTGGQKMPCLGD